MTVEVLDSFNRLAANLATSPSGRWNIPAPGGALVSAFKLDGQFCVTGSTTTASTISWAHFYGQSPGLNTGEWSVRAQRGTAEIQAIGVIARAAVNTADRERYWFGITNESGTWRLELRLYTTYTSYLTPVLGSVTLTSIGGTADLNWHTYSIRFVSAGTGLVNITCRYDNQIVFSLLNMPDPLTSLGFSTYRAVGIQYITTSTFHALDSSYLVMGTPTTGVDFAAFDNATYNNLASGYSEPAPALVAEPVLTPVSVTAEDPVIGFYTHPAPDEGEVVDERWWTNRSVSEAGYAVTFAKWTAGRRLWSLRWTNLPVTPVGLPFPTNPDFVITALITHFQEALGPVNAYDWEGPDGNTHRGHLLLDTLSYEQVAGNVFTGVTAVFEELL